MEQIWYRCGQNLAKFGFDHSGRFVTQCSGVATRMRQSILPTGTEVVGSNVDARQFGPIAQVKADADKLDAVPEVRR